MAWKFLNNSPFVFHGSNEKSYKFGWEFSFWLNNFSAFGQIDKEIVLLSVLKEPVSRSIFDYALRSKDIGSLFRHLLLRQKKRNGSIPECPIPEDPAIAQLLKKLLSQVRKINLSSILVFNYLFIYINV